MGKRRGEDSGGLKGGKREKGRGWWGLKGGKREKGRGWWDRSWKENLIVLHEN